MFNSETLASIKVIKAYLVQNLEFQSVLSASGASNFGKLFAKCRLEIKWEKQGESEGQRQTYQARDSHSNLDECICVESFL